jgi:hypothetical protein
MHAADTLVLDSKTTRPSSIRPHYRSRLNPFYDYVNHASKYPTALLMERLPLCLGFPTGCPGVLLHMGQLLYWGQCVSNSLLPVWMRNRYCSTSLQSSHSSLPTCGIASRAGRRGGRSVEKLRFNKTTILFSLPSLPNQQATSVKPNTTVINPLNYHQNPVIVLIRISPSPDAIQNQVQTALDVPLVPKRILPAVLVLSSGLLRR